MIGVAARKEVLVDLPADQFAAFGRTDRVVDLDHGDGPPQLLQDRLDDAGKGPVRDQEFGLAMFQDKGDGRGIEAVV